MIKAQEVFSRHDTRIDAMPVRRRPPCVFPLNSACACGFAFADVRHASSLRLCFIKWSQQSKNPFVSEAFWGLQRRKGMNLPLFPVPRYHSDLPDWPSDTLFNPVTGMNRCKLHIHKWLRDISCFENFCFRKNSISAYALHLQSLEASWELLILPRIFRQLSEMRTALNTPRHCLWTFSTDTFYHKAQFCQLILQVKNI